MQKNKKYENPFEDMKYRYVLKGSRYGNHELTRIQNSVRQEYGQLRTYLSETIRQLDNRNIEKKVTVTELNLPYVIEPKFTKQKHTLYRYCQKQYLSHNSVKKVKTQNGFRDLDSEGCFESEKRLDVNQMQPYYNGDYLPLTNVFEEQDMTRAPKNDAKTIVNPDGSFYRVTDTDQGTMPTEADILDVLKHLGYSTPKLQKRNNTQWLSDQAVKPPFFKSKKNNTHLREKDIVIENSDESEEDATDYFFEDIQGRVYATYRNKDSESRIQVELSKQNRLNNQLTIRRSDNLPFEDEVASLTFEVNTLNLHRQKTAFDNIIRFPSKHNLPLLEIAYKNHKLKNPELQRVSRYKFLAETGRQGTKEQREFVKKALATEDFMLLEGPPGSGKTTAILELIYQIFKSNPSAKVLLSASTHVAIDNVVERFVTMKKEELDIDLYPIRLGLTTNISATLQNISYEKISESHGQDMAETYLQSANLVCGTTMGIVKYLASESTDEKPYIFDYLIIDEASKTTLQEFIVPAQLSKRYILTGDINQLAPYTDTFYVETLIKSSKYLTLEKQEALLLHFNIHRSTKKKTIFVHPHEKTLISLKDMNAKQKDTIVIITEEEVEGVFSGKQKIVLNERLYKGIKEFLPRNYDVITKSVFPAAKLPNVKSFERFIELVNQSREKALDVLSGDWAKEVAWRLIRHHELKKESHYRKDLELLTEDENVRKEMEAIADISIPSVLLKLQEGVRTSTNWHDSIIKNGFPEQLKSSRFVALKYQHRMHPAVAEYVTSTIYNKKLESSKNVIEERQSFPRLFKTNQRNLFIDSRSTQVCTNYNAEEIKVIKGLVAHLIDRLANHHEKITIAILPFYRKQEGKLKEMLKAYYRKMHNIDNPRFRENTIGNLTIQLYTVDKFQGREADITINPLTRNRGIGFMNVPNRINVAMSRAKHYRIIIGDKTHFSRFRDLPFITGLIDYSVQKKEGDLL